MNFVSVTTRNHSVPEVPSSAQPPGSLDPSRSVLEELPEAAPSFSRPSSMVSSHNVVLTSVEIHATSLTIFKLFGFSTLDFQYFTGVT